MDIRIYSDKRTMGEASAAHAAGILREAIAARGGARIIVGTGPSQDEMIRALTEAPGLDWARITVFHMDEYAGISREHPASFRRWLKEHVADRVWPGQVHYLEGDAADLDAECRRYAELLVAAPIDITFLGFGENGHIAFNDPHAADFNDPLTVKRVAMDLRCRQQQVGEGHFPDVDAMPAEALTITCPALLACRHAICTVPDRRKAEAVRNAIEGPLTTACPASAVRTHPCAVVFLDRESASLLTGNPTSPGSPA